MAIDLPPQVKHVCLTCHLRKATSQRATGKWSCHYHGNRRLDTNQTWEGEDVFKVLHKSEIAAQFSLAIIPKKREEKVWRKRGVTNAVYTENKRRESRTKLGHSHSKQFNFNWYTFKLFFFLQLNKTFKSFHYYKTAITKYFHWI